VILLTATNQTLELVTSAATSTDVYVAFVDITTTTFAPGQQNANIASATTTAILAAPAASTQRQVKFLSVRNKSTTASQTVTLLHDTATVERSLTATLTLAAGEVLEYNDGTGFVVKNAAGQVKQTATDTIGQSGLALELLKIGTATEAAGVRYCFNKDSGFPGAWVPGAPGVNGWWTDASQATNAANPAGATQCGCWQLPNPASGGYYLNQVGIAASVASMVELFDLLWYNTGLVVTTLTAQAITMPATSIPARDSAGTTNGEDWLAGIYVTTATTNAGAIANTTMSYTNSEGTAGRTATMAAFPATAVIGTFVPFELAAGDRGIRSIQSVTLGTSYVAGALSVMLYRTITCVPNPLANVGGIMNKLTDDPTGTRLYNGTALCVRFLPSATTATTVSGCLRVVNR
jgi:hypothetical protein